MTAAAFLCARTAVAQVTVNVDPSADQRSISPLVYGVNFASSTQLSEGNLTVTRWGGNRTTRYNYLVDADNTAADYYFENLPGCWGADRNWCSPTPTDPKEQSNANAFLQAASAASVVTLFTVPTMGWVATTPKYGHPFDCSCTSGGQDSYDPYDTACGNGLVGGQSIDCGPETDTSIAIDPQWVKDWVTYLVGKFGPSNGKRIYALDNEPNLWSSTHRDVRKTRLGFDELWQRMRDYAVAILEADPTAEIAGPAEWGWPNYLCSDADVISQGCSPSSPDRAAHGGAELVAWLLDQASLYEQQNGKRILHYLDLHYYPQGGNPPQITRSLWDGTYTDPSWINDTIRLVPRMRDWVSAHYAGTKLAVSEYDFYHHNEAVGAVTYAEVLGIFTREGIDLATAWAAPAPTEAAFAAYRLFRNYDGAGGAYESTSVRATVTGSGVAAYAAAGLTRLTVVLVNEGTSATSATVDTGAFQPASAAKVYQHTGTSGDVVAEPDAAVTGTSATVALPAESITMVVFTGTNPYGNADAGAGGATSTGGTAGTAGAGGTAGSGGTAGNGGTISGGGIGGGASNGGVGGPDAGAGGATGSGGSAATGGAASRAKDSSGCGCSVPGSRRAPLGWLAAASWLTASVRRRRRRTR